MDKYVVYSDFSLEHLESSVNIAISEGYQPLGGISIAAVNYKDDEVVLEGGTAGILYTQAVYKP